MYYRNWPAQNKQKPARRVPVEALVMPTKNDVPRNYLIEAVKKITEKYYTPQRILQRIEQEETAKPNFDFVIDE